MSTKEEKPTLAGVQNKTRKRNIIIPSDPGSFSDAIIQIIQDASHGVSVEADLEAAAKAIDLNSELEFSRYGDTLFEVLFAGGRLVQGGNLAEDENRKKLETNVLASKGDREAILPFIKVFQTLTRRRPFLIRALENTLIKLLLSLEFFEEESRRKLATALSLVFSQKVGVLPENIFHALLNDRLVAKGTVLDLLTITFREFLAKDPLEDLVAILTKGKVANRLLDFFPPSKRTNDDFAQHFEAVGLNSLVEWNLRREVDNKVNELAESLGDMMCADPPSTPSEILAMAKSKKAEGDLPDSEVLRVIWISMIKAVNFTGKNQQQVAQAILKSVKTYRKLLSTFATSSKVELSLLITIQCMCYEDNRLLKLFGDIVKLLYDGEILGEDTIQHWYKKASHTKGRNVFLKDIEPFMKWLEEAEEDEEEEEKPKAAAKEAAVTVPASEAEAPKV